MADLNELKPVGKLNPFAKFCCTIGNLPTSYMISLTYEEQLLWLCNYLEKTVIPAVNTNAEAVQELQELYVVLKNYVDNYFENLDVQEEINNKLDEMAESGTLEEIVADYLNSKAIFGFDTVNDMKQATNLIDGSYAKTLGYYSANDGGAGLYKIVDDDTLVDDGGSIHQLENGLKAELIVKDIANVKQFGAKGNGTIDDTVAFQNALDKYKIIYVPKGSYVVDNLILDSNYKIIGEDKYRTYLKQKEGQLSTPILKSNFFDETHQMSNISLENIGVVSKGERTVYPIRILNSDSTNIINCLIIQDATNGASNSYYHGVEIDRTENFTGKNFVTKIKGSRFSKSKIKINSTDSIIVNNEIWGNELDCAIHATTISNTIIDGNEFVGGKIYGAIYLEAFNEGLKITSNYFDGSWDSIDSKYAIYGNDYFRHSVISSNNFWKQKSGALFLKNSQSNVISNNAFEDNDYYNNGDPDIEIRDDNSMASFNNIVSNNTFFRQKYFNKTSGETENRPTTNVPPVIKMKNTSGYPASIVKSNTCSYIQFYGDSVFEGNILSKDNVSSKFFYIYNYAYTTNKNDKDIIFTDNNNILTNKTSALINGQLLRIDNINTITTSNLGSFDFNASSTEDYRVYVTDRNSTTNKPTFFTAGTAFVEYNVLSGNGYAVQKFTGIDSNSNTYTKSRMLLNGQWTNWS